MKIEEAKIINIPRKIYDKMLEHCYRKLEKKYYDYELQEQKAYGLLSGEILDNEEILVKDIYPLYKNGRYEDKERMDKKMKDFATPSETPLEKRGWVVDNNEMGIILDDCIKNDTEIIGAYHMHRVSWETDVLRDTPTILDTELAKDSGTIVVIISVVDPQKPIVRFFYEGILNKELKCSILEYRGEGYGLYK